MNTKNKKPRGKTPSLIGLSNGRPKKVEVKAKSECFRCGCAIHVGQDCFGIPKGGSGFSSLKRYCSSCFKKIIDQTQKDLEELRTYYC